MTTILLAVALLFVVLQPVQTARPIVGAYACHGTQNGQRYEMPLAIAEFGHAYQLTWGDPATVMGLGLLQEGRLAVALVVPRTGAVGVASYVVTPGRLEGIWSRGDGSIDVETCQQGRPA